MQNTGQSALGLLVLYTLPQEPSRWEALRGGQWTVLSFLSEEEDKDFLDASATRGIEVTEIVRAAQVIDAAALRTRENTVPLSRTGQNGSVTGDVTSRKCSPIVVSWHTGGSPTPP